MDITCVGKGYEDLSLGLHRKKYPKSSPNCVKIRKIMASVQKKLGTKRHIGGLKRTVQKLFARNFFLGFPCFSQQPRNDHNAPDNN